MIAEKYTSCAITIVLDNARYHKYNLVRETVSALRIELLFLPTYSTNLNLIERLWRFVKKECLYSKYYKTSAEFDAVIELSFPNQHSKKTENGIVDNLEF